MKFLSKAHWGEYGKDVEAAFLQMKKDDFFGRFFKKDATLWKDDAAVGKEIVERLGWLDAPAWIAGVLPDLKAFAASVKEDGFDRAVLLGMGGSSLAPEVIQTVCGSAVGYPELIVLDSTDPRRIRDVEAQIEGKKTLFIVASKSGTTIESLSLYKYFYEKTKTKLDTDAAGSFIAITDPGLSLETEAKSEGFRKVFLNDPDVGGRFSALTFFGLVPAALIGVDLDALHAGVLAMDKTLRSEADPEKNPAGALGAGMAVLAQRGRDKITIVTQGAWAVFGDWAEQLIAESTGKEGKGVMPIARESLAGAGAYGADRFFAALKMTGDDGLNAPLEALKTAGHPVLALDIEGVGSLGAEFLRWEVATAVAGYFLQINPFDQPNVQEAKDATKAILKGVTRQTDLSPDAPEPDWKVFFDKVKESDSVNLLAFLPARPEIQDTLRAVAELIRQKKRSAVNVGIGPRYLHSTGQLHKGGPDRCAFVVIASPAGPEEDLVIPEAVFSFKQLVLAQARGDFEALSSKGRRVVCKKLNSLSDKALKEFHAAIQAALT